MKKTMKNLKTHVTVQKKNPIKMQVLCKSREYIGEIMKNIGVKWFEV